MDRTAGKEAGCHAIRYCSIAWHRGGSLFIATLCSACIVLFASDASAQCTARDVLRNHLTLKRTPSAGMPPILVRSAAAAPVWRTIAIGTFANSFALRNALDAAGCGIGDLAQEILARPAFTLRTARTEVELIAVSAAELGFQTDTVSLADIYARAQQLGFGLAAAEVAPQLRLQYFDQPMGETILRFLGSRDFSHSMVRRDDDDGSAELSLALRNISLLAKAPATRQKKR